MDCENPLLKRSAGGARKSLKYRIKANGNINPAKYKPSVRQGYRLRKEINNAAKVEIIKSSPSFLVHPAKPEVKPARINKRGSCLYTYKYINATVDKIKKERGTSAVCEAPFI